MAKTKRPDGLSTRDLIISGANQIINRTGVVDFRVETLAQTLGLSPGNITYHFPRKEDIIVAIWEEFRSVMREVGNELITPLLDIKQLYLFYRTLFSKVINYAGVVAYYYGDVGALTRENKFHRKQLEENRRLCSASSEILIRNGYLRQIEGAELSELTFASQHIMLRWWINHAQSKVTHRELPQVVDKYVALLILQLIPYLTEAGIRQFESINNLIK